MVFRVFGSCAATPFNDASIRVWHWFAHMLSVRVSIFSFENFSIPQSGNCHIHTMKDKHVHHSCCLNKWDVSVAHWPVTTGHFCPRLRIISNHFISIRSSRKEFGKLFVFFFSSFNCLFCKLPVKAIAKSYLLPKFAPIDQKHSKLIFGQPTSIDQN